MRSIEMSVTTTPQKSDVIKTKNVHLENKAALNTVSILVAWSESESAAAQDTDWKELKIGEVIFFSAERKQIVKVWAKTLSGTANLSITGSNASINKPASDNSRLAWHDRNPVNIMRNYNSSEVPDTETQRWTYTVPAGKKAFVEILFALIGRATVATTVGYAEVNVRLAPGGAGATKIVLLPLRTNNIGDYKLSTLGTSIIMQTGDVLYASTMDTSTGGTLDFSINTKITEFDA